MVNLADLGQLLVALAVIVLAARLLGALAGRLGQPPVIGEILAGILLGPTLAGGALTAAVFPSQVRPPLALLSTVGVCVFMFFVGLHLDRQLLRGQVRIAVTTSVSGIVLPLGLGLVLALYLAGHHTVGNFPAFALFIGVAMAITAFPVLARILSDKGLVRTPIGGMALACAALDDVFAWSLLAGVAAIGSTRGAPWQVLLVIPFAVVLLRIVRPLLARLADRRPAIGKPGAVGVLVAGAAGLTACAAATDRMGLHPIFGAFLFGLAMPRHCVPWLRERVLPRVEKVSSLVLLPVFFLTAGLNVDLSGVTTEMLADLLLILAVAIGGKGIGGFVGARLCGARPRHAAVLAILINTRGLTELIALTVGLQLGLLDRSLYSLMVVMALVTTGMTGVLLRFVYPPEQIRRDLAAGDTVDGTRAPADTTLPEEGRA